MEGDMRLRGLILSVAIVLASCTSVSTADAPTISAPAVSANPINSAAAEQSTGLPKMESTPVPTEPKTPTITNQVWLNTDQPLTQADLSGKVILIDFWTFG
jgi:uncharacterized protein YceK